MEYKIVLEPDVEEGGYVVHCPALAGCYSQGDTKEEATENIREAIEAYLESLEKDNLPIPVQWSQKSRAFGFVTKLPVVSGQDLVSVLAKAGFDVHHQRGSHIILKQTVAPFNRLSVQNHRELKPVFSWLSSARLD